MTHEKKVRPLTIENPSLANFVLLMTVGVLFAWSLASGILNPTILHIDDMVGFIKMFGIVGVLAFIFSNKRRLYVSIGFLVVLLILLVSGFFLTPEHPNLASRMALSLTNTIEFIGGHRSHTDLYEMISIWTIWIMVGLFVVVFSYFRFRFLILFITSIIIFSVVMTSRYFSYTHTFYVFVFSILVLFMRHLHQQQMRFAVAPEPFTIYMVVLTAISLLIAAFTPTPQAGFAEGVIQNVIQRPFDLINDLFADLTQPNEFSLRQVGFGGSGRLGGNIAPNDDLFMRIRTTRSGAIYLTGAIMETYTGDAWVSYLSDENPVDFSDIDQKLEMIEYTLVRDLNWLGHFIDIPIDRFVPIEAPEGYHLRDGTQIFEDPVTEMMIWASSEPSGSWDVNGYLSSNPNRMSIDVLGLRPVSVFHFGIVHDIAAQNVDDLSFLRDRNGRFFAERRMPANTLYTISYIDQDHWNHDQSILQATARGGLGHIYHLITTFRDVHGYEVMFTMAVEHEGSVISFEDLLTDHLIPRAEQIDEIYTALPDEFPARVGELALEVTEGASNDYERMRLLESYLSENFAYTLTPGPSPFDQDFVEHFLFDIQAGYCVHFATAFVTMARSLGMPARYVEGFLINTQDARDEEAFIDVLNSMAHAWAEVYFEGFGWVRFEPTPSSGLPRPLAGSNSETNVAEREADQPVPEEGRPENPDQQPEIGDTDLTPTTPVVDALQVEEAGGSSMWVWLLIGMGSTLVLMMARIAVVEIKIKQAKGKTNHEAVIHLFSVIRSYLNGLACHMEAGETAKQFVTRASHEVFDDEYMIQELLRKSAEIFSKARYSRSLISDEECQIMESTVDALDDRMKDEEGWKYFYKRYVRIRY